MKPGIDPKVDYVFKWLFGKDGHLDLLIGLLNAVLKLPSARQIESVQIINPINDKDALDDKLSVLDIRARDQFGSLYNVEMQMRRSHELTRRLLYYWAVMYTDQLQEGEEYAELRPCITICFLDGILFPGVPDYHLNFELRSAPHPQLVFNDQLAIHLVELPKFGKSATELGDLFDSWCYFLIHGDELDTENLPKSMQHSIVGKAMEELAMFAQSDVEKQRYRDRIKAERDHKSFLREAREEGLEKGREEGLEKGREEGLERGREEGLERGREEGLERGELLGRIHAFQTLLKQPLSSPADLASVPLADLRAMADRLEQQLANK